MRIFYKKTKYRIVMMIVLAMLLQIIGPMVSNVYAEVMEQSFKIVGESFENGNAYIQWEFTLDPNDKVEKHTYTGNFTLGNEVSEELKADDGTVIGTYSISTDGEVTVTIDQSLYEGFENLDEPEDVIEGSDTTPGTLDDEKSDLNFEEESLVEGEQSKEDEAEQTTEETVEGESAEGNDGQVDNPDPNGVEEPEGTEAPETSEGIIGKALGLIASASENLEGLLIVDEKEEVKTFYSGIIEVGGAKEKPTMMSSFTLFSGESGNDLGNIFEVVGLWIGRVDGEEGTVVEENRPVDIGVGDIVTMRYNWDIKGKNAQPGDTASIKIPDIFDVTGDFPSSPLWLSDGLTEVGTWTIKDGYLQLTFGDGLSIIDTEGLSDTFVEFGFELKLSEFEEDITQIIEFNDSVNKKLNLTIKPKNTGNSITKVGVPDVIKDDDGNYKDAKTITWTIDVMNTEESPITGAKIIDETPEGLSLDTNSFTITELTMGYNGVISTKGNPKSIDNPYNGTGFEILLDDMEPYKGYRIIYTTNIENFSKNEFINTATLDNGDGQSIDATATVNNLTRSAPMEKSGAVNGAKDEITWNIYVNKGGISINKPIVKDTLPAGLSIKEVEGVKQVTVSKRNSSGDYDVVTGIDISNFPDSLEFPAIGPDDVYKIVYVTTIDYLEVNGGNYKKDNEFENKATLSDDTTKIGEEVKHKVSFERRNILNKLGYKPVEYVDTLTWTINVNQAYHKITDAKIIDKIPAGLEFNVEDVNIRKKAKGGTWETITVNVSVIDGSGDDVGKKIVTIDLEDIQDEYEIVYKTKMVGDGFKKDASFTNEVYLHGNGIEVGTDGNPISKTVTPDNNYYYKGSTGIDYDNKTIEWEIEIDPIKEPITQLNIEDTFPNKGLILLPGTLKVMKGGTELVRDTHYTLSPHTEGGVTGYQKGFNLKFDQVEALPLSGQKIVITYKTSYDPQLEVEGNKLDPSEEGITKYKNKAVITGTTKSGQIISEHLEKDTFHNEGGNVPSWNSGKKEGRRINVIEGEGIVADWRSGEERLIEWKIYINYLKQNLGKNVKVTDTLKYDGKINLDSVKIMKYTVDPATGVPSDGEALDDYKSYVKPLEDEGKKLSIDFGDFTVNERYVIIYMTTVPDKSLPSYSNEAIVDVGGTEYPYDASVSYAEAEEFIDKKALDVEGKTVYTDDEIDWELAINESLSTNFTNVEITDTIAKGMAYKEDSLKVYRVEGDNEVSVTDDYTFDFEGDHNTSTTLKIGFDRIDHKYIIRYKTIVIAKTGTVSNNAVITGSMITSIKESGETLIAEKFGFTGGKINPKKGKLRITKVDGGVEGNPIIDNNPVEAQFKLWYDLNGIPTEFNDGQLFTAKNGVLDIENLPLREYELEEITAPKGYDGLKNKIKINVDKQFQDNPENIILVQVENNKSKVDVKGVKEWIGGPKPSITLQLFRDNVLQYEKLLTGQETTPWSYTWRNLDKTDEQGNEYVYRVDEKDVPEHYTRAVTEIEGGFKITNTYTSPKTSVTVNKIWVDGPTPRPSINLQLYRNNEPYGDKITLTDGTTSHTWTDLDETDENGVKYEYTVDEDKVLNYGKSISKSEDGSTITITNTYGSPKADVIGRKIWINGSTNRSTIKLQLYRNGIEEGSPVELRNGDLSYIWKDLDITDSKGIDYIYTVNEVNVPENYTKLEDGLIVTNTYVIPKTKVTGKKVWVGGSSVKPTIELQLYRDGEPYGETVELKDGETEYTWIDLDKTDINGREYKYTIDEVSVLRNYRKSVSEDGLTITNRYVPPYEPPYEPPTKPTDPDPKDPEKPVEPTKPVEPEKPTEPPTEPVVPVDPTKPTEPPTDPVVPVEPTNPTEPTDPEKPTVPTEPTIKEKTPKEKPIEIDPKIPEGSTPKVVEEPKNGKVTFDENGKWIYTPNPDFVGKDSFIIKVTHPDGTEEDIFIEIDVEAPAGGVEVPTLPKTGQANSILMYLAGLFFIVVGIILRKRIA